MDINKTQIDGKTIFSLSGRLDTNTAPKMLEVLKPEFDRSDFGKPKHIVLDFADIVYVSSAGLRVLLIGEKTDKATGICQTLVNVSAEIMAVFEITGFSDVLHIE